MCFGHTYWQFIPTEFCKLFELVLSFFLEDNRFTTIDFSNNLSDFCFQAIIIRIKTFIIGITIFNSINYCVGKFNTTISTISPNASQFNRNIDFCTKFFKGCNFSFCISNKLVNSNDCRKTEFTNIFHMTFQVSEAITNSLNIFFREVRFGYPTVHFKGTKCRNNNNSIRSCWEVWSLDIKEFFSSKVSTETCFRNCIICQT